MVVVLGASCLGLYIYSTKLLTVESTKDYKEIAYSLNDEKIKNEVESVCSMIDGIYDKKDKGIYTEQQVESIAKDIVRNTVYDNGNGYFKADAFDGELIAHHSLQKDEGINRIRRKG